MLSTNMKNRRSAQFIALLLTGTATFALSTPALAQNRWDGSGSNDYNNAANWSQNAVPTESSAVVIDDETNAPVVDGEGTVAAAGNLSVGEAGTGRLTIRNGADLILGNSAGGGLLSVGGSQTTGATTGNGTLVVTGAGSTVSGPGGLTLGVALNPNTTGLLQVLDGAVLTSSGARIGTAPGSNGILTVSGAGSRWDITGGSGSSIGNSNFVDARGTLNVLDGGKVIALAGTSWDVGPGGTINVAGAGSLLEVPTQVFVRGAVNVADGGAFQADSIVLSGFDGPARLEINGPGSNVTVTSLSISNISTSSSTLLIANGGTLSARQASFASFGGRTTTNVTVTGAGSLLSISANANSNPNIGSGNNQANLNILAGGRVESLTTFNFGVGQNTSVLLSGADSTLDIAGNLSISASSVGQPVGSFVIENDASLLVHGPSDSGLGFGAIRDVVIRNGGSWIMDGGTGAGLQIETTNLLVDGGTLSATGDVRIGARFSGSTLSLLNANFSARSLNAVAGSNTLINLGGTRTSAAGAVGLFDVGTIFIGDGNALVINHTGTNLDIDAVIGTGTGRIEHLAGDTSFSSGTQGGFAGIFDITGGRVRVNGLLGGAGMHTLVSGGATLGGSGTLGGDVTLADATLAAGNSAGIFTIGGDLILGAGSELDFELGAPDLAPGVGSDLVNVGGDLTLDGMLNISDIGGFGSGLYRLINYGGALTDNGLEFGIVPASFESTGLTLDLATGGQVNLLAAAPDVDFIFWDGSNSSANGGIDGGSGSWTVDGTNWTIANGSANGAYDPANFLIFTGPTNSSAQAKITTAAATPSVSAGTVTIDSTAGSVSITNGVQFAVDGYTVTGDPLRLTSGDVVFRVGDGSAQGGDFVATVESDLTGSGRLIKTDLGTLILLGDNSYDGGTRVSGGTLQGNTTSLIESIEIELAGKLLFDQQSGGEFAGALSGAGLLTKEGVGELLLSGDSSSFIGQTILSQGAINLTGQLGSTLNNSAILTSAGTRLLGTGIAGNLDISGTIAPGAVGTTGTLTALGSAIFRAGSIYEVNLAASGASDLVSAADDIVIEGGTVAVSLLDPDLTYTDGSVFVIAQGGNGLTGTFDGLTEDSAFLDFDLGYDPTRAFLTVSLVRMFPDVALTFNQREAAAGLMELDQTAGSDSLAVYNAILFLDGDQARSAFDLASGEIYSDILMSAQRGGGLQSAALRSRGFETGKPGWNAWIGGGIGRSRVSSDGNGERFTNDLGRFELGLDYHAGDDMWAAGVSGGWATTEIGNAARLSNANLDGWFGSGFVRYGNYADGPTAVFAASRSKMSGQAQRTIRFGTIDRNTGADVDIGTTTLAADIRYGFGGDKWSVGPVVGFDHAASRLGSFAENGAGALDLSSAGASDAWTHYNMGGFLSYRSDSARILFDARYEFGEADDSVTRLSLSGSPAVHRNLAARGNSDGLALTVKAVLDLGSTWSMGSDLNASLAGEEGSLQGNAWLRFRF